MRNESWYAARVGFLCITMVIAQPKPRNSLHKVLYIITWFASSLCFFNLMNRRKLLDQEHPFIILSRPRSTITNSITGRGWMVDNLRRRQHRHISRTNLVTSAFSFAVGFFLPEKQNNSFTFFHGVTFSRTITQTAPGVNITLTFNQGDQHCQTKDEYGDDDCKYHWGENMGGLLSGSLPYDLIDGDLVIGKFHIDEVTPLTFTCNICGQPCMISIPVINQEILVDTPKCPIEKDRVYQSIGEILPERVFLPETVVKGTLKAVKADGVTVILSAEVDIKVHW